MRPEPGTKATFGRSALPRRPGLPGALGAALLLTACFPPFGPFGPFPPFPSTGEGQFTVENATEDNWVVRATADGFPMDFAVPAGAAGVAYYFGGTLDEISLLDLECQEVDTIEGIGAPELVRIEADGTLATARLPDVSTDEALVEYFECGDAFGFGEAPAAGEPVDGASGTLTILGAEGGAWSIGAGSAELSALTRPPEGSAFDTEHALSPDGSRLAFVRYAEEGVTGSLIVANTEGSGETLLADNAGAPVWSPDGTRIAYLDLDAFSGGSTLTVIDADGGEPRPLAEDASVPHWSPDGSRLVFMSMDLGRFMGPAEPPSELRMVDADGTGERVLAEAAPFADRPAWAPDGTRIAFVSGADSGTAMSVIDLNAGISTVAEIANGYLAEPKWSPDGSRIAFTISTNSLFTADGALGVVPATGGEVQRIGQLRDAWYLAPTWSPDGAWLAATRSTGMDVSSDLVVVEVATGAETVLATGVQAISDWRK